MAQLKQNQQSKRTQPRFTDGRIFTGQLNNTYTGNG